MSEQQGSLGFGPGPASGQLTPLIHEPDYPAILLEMAVLLATELASAGVDVPHAEALAETVAEHVRERFGGQNIYLPKGEAARARRRRAMMWADFTGDNYRELAHKYGMSLQHAYRRIRLARAEHMDKTQGDLFKSQS